MPYVCPWWFGYFLINPFRRLRQEPHAILSPLVAEGMTVLEPGPGMGFFTLELARLVGASGRVVAVDVQQRMLAALRRRAARHALAGRIETRLAGDAGLGIEDLAGGVDFALLFAMVHEVPDQARLFTEIGAALKSGGTALLAEPRGHVRAPAFAATLDLATAHGFVAVDRPAIAASHTALLRKR